MDGRSHLLQQHRRRRSEAEEDGSGEVEAANAEVVTGDSGLVVVGGRPDIADTRLIGLATLPELLQRLYGWKSGGLGLEARGKRLGLPREADNFNCCFCLTFSIIVYTHIY
jgi:hypothetical protein